MSLLPTKGTGPAGVKTESIRISIVRVSVSQPRGLASRGPAAEALERFLGAFQGLRTVTECWEPAADVYETDRAVRVLVELPGVDAESIELARDNGELVPFAKAYSGLTDEEIRKLDNWIRRSTVEKFGPVRSVRPEQVFEIAFEGIQPSTRHRSGVAVRFPRIARWREDKRAEDADTIAVLRSLIGAA